MLNYLDLFIIKDRKSTKLFNPLWIFLSYQIRKRNSGTSTSKKILIIIPRISTCKQVTVFARENDKARDRNFTWKYLRYAAGRYTIGREWRVVTYQSLSGVLAPIPKNDLLIPCGEIRQEQRQVFRDCSINPEHVTAFHYHRQGCWPLVAPRHATKKSQFWNKCLSQTRARFCLRCSLRWN